MARVQVHGVRRKDHFVDKVEEALSSKSCLNQAFRKQFFLHQNKSGL